MQVLLALVLCLLVGCFAENFFDFTVKNIRGEEVPLSTYKDSRVILVVNTASHCGYTHDNYKQMQDMYTRLQPKGLEILGKSFVYVTPTCITYNMCSVPLQPVRKPGAWF